MSAPRLPFLYPAHFFKPASRTQALFLRKLTTSSTPSITSTTSTRPLRPVNQCPHYPCLQKRNVTLTRHGSAVEPPPLMPEEMSTPAKDPLSTAKETIEGINLIKQSANEAQTTTNDTESASEDETKPSLESQPVLEEKLVSESKALKEITRTVAHEEPPEGVHVDEEVREQAIADADVDKPLKKIPGVVEEMKKSEFVLPKLYHNFDTWTMVTKLKDAGFSDEQSMVAMKLIRGMISIQMFKTKQVLLTKSKAENETYLFRAACSELRTETQHSRRVALDRIRLERGQIQHDYDQIVQRFSEDLMNLKDEVSSQFNDRKITMRQEQRGMEVKIQEMNYKLTILLNGDLRTEIESLRWTTTRRGLVAIFVLASTIVAFIKLTGAGTHTPSPPPSAEPLSKPTSSDSTSNKYNNEMLLIESLLSPTPPVPSMSSNEDSHTSRDTMHGDYPDNQGEKKTVDATPFVSLG